MTQRSYVPVATIESMGLQQALTNVALLLAGLTSDFTNQNTPNLANLTSLATACGCTAVPMPNYQLDGEQWNWTDYQTFLVEKNATLRQALQRSFGPFSVVS